MLSLALIGKDISHSKSQEMYEEILGHEIEYTLIDCESESNLPSLKSLFEQFKGVSITSPYKRAYLDQVALNKQTEIIGAINCLVPENDQVRGVNTDFLAVQDLLPRIIKDSNVTSVTILGNGAMAEMTKIALSELSFPYEQFARSIDGDISKLDLNSIHSGKPTLVINCCSREFVFKGNLGKCDIFWDYNYQFVPHQYLSETHTYIDGLELLKLQAKFALKEWKIL